MLKKIINILYKDIKIDLSLKHLFLSVALYLVSAIYIIYVTFDFSEIYEFDIWVSLFWIVVLFVSITSISKSFFHESHNRNYYYYYLFSPSELIIAKLIYNFIFLLILFFIAITFYSFLLGNLFLSKYIFLLLFLGAFSISNCLTLVSAISFQVKRNSVIIGILSFPVIIPILKILIDISKVSHINSSWNVIENDFYILLLINIIAVSLSYILFNYLWKN